MIVQALFQRYKNLVIDPQSGVSELYFSSGKVSYVLEIDDNGTLLDIKDIRSDKGKKKVPRSVILPEQPSRSSGIYPYFLSDKAEYILGYYALAPNDSITEKKSENARKKFEASKILAQSVLAHSTDIAAQAVLKFYTSWNPSIVREHPQIHNWIEDLDKGIDTNMAFRLISQKAFIHDSPQVKEAWILYRKHLDTQLEYVAQCLVTGETGASIARTHDKIKGVRNAQAAGASLISFNFRSVESYGKDSLQSYNAPISKNTMFGYTTALNHLVASPVNRIILGDMTVVFWSDKPELEPLIAKHLDPTNQTEQPDAEEPDPYFASFAAEQTSPVEDKNLTSQLGGALEHFRNGVQLESYLIPHGETLFYILGLSPNNARLAVRFFWKGELKELIEKLEQHVSDLAIIHTDDRHHAPTTLYKILVETMRVGNDGKKVGEAPPPRLGGELFRSVILGTAYPHSLYTMIITRIRADGIVNYLRCAIIKAYITRHNRIQNNEKIKEALHMGLNTEAEIPAYRLGRLFAVLERAQQDAAGGAGKLNATIKDRYFSSASTNPAAVFPILIKLAQHHMSKSKFGDFRDREMQDILQGVDNFPVHLDIQQQGLFILGYYHQKQNFTATIKAAVAKQEALAADE